MSNDQTIVIDTPDGLTHAYYARLKGRLKLEKVGLKFRDGAARPKLAAAFGLKPKAPYDDYIAYCESQMAILIAKK